jgi:hypothetical protein
MAPGAVRNPSRRQAFLVFGEHRVGVAHAAIVRHRAGAGQRAAEILLHEAQRPADAGAGWPLRIRPEAAEAGIEPDLPPDGAIDDDDREGTARGGLQLVGNSAWVQKCLDRGQQHRQVFGPAAGHGERGRA